jgi:hypothetical protein
VGWDLVPATLTRPDGVVDEFRRRDLRAAELARGRHRAPGGRLDVVGVVLDGELENGVPLAQLWVVMGTRRRAVGGELEQAR